MGSIILDMLERIPVELDVSFHRECGGEIMTTCQMAMPCSVCSKCGNEILLADDVIKVRYRRMGVL